MNVKRIVIKYKVKIIIKKYYLNQMKCIVDNSIGCFVKITV